MARRKPSKRRRSNASEYATKADIADIYQVFEERRKWLDSIRQNRANAS
jgi:hypothetical protein